MQILRFKPRFSQKKNRNSARLGRALVLLLSGLALSACNGKGGLESFCAEMPGSRAELASLRAAIATYIPPAHSGRRIASVTSGLEGPSEDMQSAWMDWTEKALKRTQWARDALEHDRLGKKAKSSLSDASLALVSIHGFIEQKKWNKASIELDQVDRHLRKASEVACVSVETVKPSVAPAKKPAADPVKRSPASLKKKKKKNH